MRRPLLRLASAAALAIVLAGLHAAASQTVPLARADVNRDCAIARNDALLVQSLLGRRVGQPGYNADADVNQDGVINNVDVTFVSRNIGKPVCAPSNSAPVITSAPATTATLLAPYAYQVTATDANADPILFSLQSAPPGMVIHPTTGLVRWTPPATGPMDVVVTASDGRGGMASQPFTLVVARPPNRPPQLTDLADREVVTGSSLKIALGAHDPDPDDVLVFSTNGAPSGMSLGPGSVLAWTPNAADVGSHPVSVRVRDATGASDTTSFNVIVVPASGPPVFGPQADATIPADSPYRRIVAATDPDPGDIVTHALVSGPEGLLVSEAGELTWTPTGEQLGPYTVKVRATDATGAAAATAFSLFVDVAHAPQAPVTNDDRYVVRRNAVLNVAAPGVLANDSDPAARPLSALLATAPTKGSATLAADGALQYVVAPPAAGSTAPALAYGIGPSATGVTLTSLRTQPIVADLDGDGEPEVVFMAGGTFATRRLVAVRGSTGQPVFVRDVYQPSATPQVVLCLSFCELAAADLDNDGTVEILGVHSDDETAALRRRIVAFNHDGSYRWTSEDIVDGTSVTQTDGLMWLTVADLEADGHPEVIGVHHGKSAATPAGVIAEDLVTVFESDGRIRWTKRVPGRPSGREVSVADIDLDGSPDLVIGGAVLEATGSVKWNVKQSISPIAYIAVGNLDDDAFPELVFHDQFGNLYRFEHNGAETWGPLRQPVLSGLSAPAIGDVDGDGRAEILRAGDGVEVWDPNGNLVRTMTLPNGLRGAGGNPVVFDLNGDGRPEVIYNGAASPLDVGFVRGALYVFDGPTGALLHTLPSSRNAGDSGETSGPVVADVTGDGSAEIVSGGWNESTVLRVFRAASGTWARTRPIWNQMGYHVTNVEASGRIPSRETAHWLTPGVNVYRMNVPLPEERISDADVLTYTAHNGFASSNVAKVQIDILAPNNAPRILSLAPKVASPGLEYLYAVRAADPDAGESLTFSLPVAPAGMSVTAQGVIRWTPSGGPQDPATVVVTVTDSQGEFDSQHFTVTVAPPATVPNLTGASPANAEAVLASAGLALGSSATSPSASVPAGVIVSQQPAAGEIVAAGSSVNILVSSGPAPVTVPHLVGRSEHAAAQVLTALGFAAAVSRDYSTAPAGEVIAQTPVAGTVMAPGTVRVTVSAGPGLVLRLRRDITTADAAIPFTARAYDLAFAEFDAPPLTYVVTPAITPYFGPLPVVSGGQIAPAPDTRGAFRLTATDPATGRSVSADFSVTFPRTVGEASMTDAFGALSEALGEIHALAADARRALAMGDEAALPGILAQMVARWRALDTFSLRFATPFGLPEGFLPPAADLPALGLTPGPDDLVAGDVIAAASADLAAWTAGLREPSTPMQTLETLARRFHSSASALQALTLSEWGGIRHAPAMTVFVTQLLPDFYDALFDELEQVVVNAGGPGPSTLAEQLVTIAVKYVIDEIAETPLHEFRESVMKQAAWTASVVAASHHFRTHNGAGSLTSLVAGASLSVHVFNAPWSFVEGAFDAAHPTNAVVVMLGPNSESKLLEPPDSIVGALSAAANAAAVYHTLNKIYMALRDDTTSPSNALGLAKTAFQSAQEAYRGCLFSSLPTCSQLVFPDGFASVYEYSPPDEFGESFTGLPVPIVVMVYDKSSGRVTIDTPVFLPTRKGS